jgi:hypothetical protein
VQTGCFYMSAPDFRQSDDGASLSRGKKTGNARGGFVREREFNRWLSRLSPGKDDWLVGKAVAIAIRRRTKPGTRITMQQLCYLSGIHWGMVMAALYLMRSNGPKTKAYDPIKNKKLRSFLVDGMRLVHFDDAEALFSAGSDDVS